MNLKLELKPKDIAKLLFGRQVMIINPYNNGILHVQKGKDTYICKG